MMEVKVGFYVVDVKMFSLTKDNFIISSCASVACISGSTNPIAKNKTSESDAVLEKIRPSLTKNVSRNGVFFCERQFLN